MTLRTLAVQVYLAAAEAALLAGRPLAALGAVVNARRVLGEETR